LFDQDTQFSVIRRQTIQIAQKLIETQRVTPLEYHPAFPEISKQEPPQLIQPTQTEKICDLFKSQSTPLVSDHQEKPLPDELTSASPSETGSTEYYRKEIAEGFSSDSTVSETDVREKGSNANYSEQGNKIGYHDSAELDDQVLIEPLDFIRYGKEQTGPIDSGYESNTISSTGSHKTYINYSCLLIPRMPQHLLSSNLASFLFTWMGQLCLAYGWRLEHLSIHPNYVQMVTGAPLSTSPAYIVRTLRQKTSHYIFAQFPPLTNENPSGDFWAPGFFISGGNQTIQPHLIDRYVKEIREHQGVNNISSL
jgi:REP element-mobilizing transposase RayT